MEKKSSIDSKGHDNQGFELTEVEGQHNDFSTNNNEKTISTDEGGAPVLDEEDGDERQHWDSPIEFLLSCIAMSVGLGNIWRFPVTAYNNGGGAFLIPYFIVLILIGRPMYFLELCLGQFTSYGQIKIWKCAPFMKGVGYATAIATMSVLTYYCSIMALAVFYFIVSFQKTLPWSECDPKWAGGCENGTSTMFNSSLPELYFRREVLKEYDNIDDGIGVPDWRLALCLLFSWVLILFSHIKGVSSSGKVAYFTALFPYVVLLILLVRGVTLPGAGKGIEFFVKPQWDKLLEPGVWYAAVSQCFFSLNTGFGSIIMFSSYNKFDHKIYRDSIIVSFMDTFTSLLAGITIFAVLGNLAEELNVDVDKVVQGGAGLAFVSYPEAIAKFTWAPQLFGVLFFLMLFTLGLGSSTSDAGAVITIFADAFPKFPRWIITTCVCVIGFSFGLVYLTPGGQWILDLVDYFGGSFVIYLTSTLEVIGIAWVYGLFNFVNDIEFMLKLKIGWYWKICWGFVIPVGLTGILIYSLIEDGALKYNDQYYPTIAYVFGWLLAGCALLGIPIAGLHSMYKSEGSFMERFFKTLKPKPDWGPRKKKDRREWLEYKESKPWSIYHLNRN